MRTKRGKETKGGGDGIANDLEHAAPKALEAEGGELVSTTMSIIFLQLSPRNHIKYYFHP